MALKRKSADKLRAVWKDFHPTGEDVRSLVAEVFGPTPVPLPEWVEVGTDRRLTVNVSHLMTLKDGPRVTLHIMFTHDGYHLWLYVNGPPGVKCGHAILGRTLLKKKHEGKEGKEGGFLGMSDVEADEDLTDFIVWMSLAKETIRTRLDPATVPLCITPGNPEATGYLPDLKLWFKQDPINGKFTFTSESLGFSHALPDPFGTIKDWGSK